MLDVGDAELHAHLGRGDFRAAGGWLVSRYANEVLGLCGAMVRDRGAAEDLAQDVFGNAFRALPSFRADASARTWLLAIAKNRCIDHLRAKKRDAFPASDGPEIDEHPDDAPLPSDLLAHRADVEEALAELSEGDRALVVLRFRHGLEHEELADVFGLKQGAVRMRLSRALARMREVLEARMHRDEKQLSAEASGFEAEELAEEAALDELATVPPPRAEAPKAGRAARGAPPPPAAAAAPPPAARSRAPAQGEEREGAAVPPPLAAPAPPPAPTGALPAKRGFLGRVLDAFGGGAAPPAPPPAPSSAPPRAERHPLALFFDATDAGVPSTLRDELMRLVSEIDSDPR
jgi:RNA polymerase sigma-70 factor (ECF subfamily)